MQSDHLHYLEECVRATEGCVETTGRAIERLQPGTRDLPRLTKVLANKHHYLLLPSPLLQQYKSELSTSLQPQIEALISRADELVDREQKRSKGLEERLELIRDVNGTSNGNAGGGNSKAVGGTGKAGVVGKTGTGDLSNPPFDPKTLPPNLRRKYIMLKGKRDRLEREKSGLE